MTARYFCWWRGGVCFCLRRSARRAAPSLPVTSTDKAESGSAAIIRCVFDCSARLAWAGFKKKLPNRIYGKLWHDLTDAKNGYPRQRLRDSLHPAGRRHHCVIAPEGLPTPTTSVIVCRNKCSPKCSAECNRLPRYPRPEGLLAKVARSVCFGRAD